MELSVDSQGNGVDFRVPVMIIIAWCSWMSIFFVCELRLQTGHSIQQRYSIVPGRKFLVQMVRCPKLFQLAFVLRGFYPFVGTFFQMFLVGQNSVQAHPKVFRGFIIW